MSRRSIEAEHRTPRGRVRPIAAAACLAAAIGFGFGIGAFADTASAAAPPTASATPPPTVSATPPSPAKACRINFQASNLNLRVGQDLVVTWAAVGADKLTASWRSGSVPLAGALTTTMNRPGTFSYQVTGTSGGHYCGSAGVQVSVTGDSPSHPAKTTSAPAVTASSTAKGSAANNGASTTGGSRSGAAKYPAQSPTGGAGVAWFEQPRNLCGVAALAMLGSLFLWKREHVRAPFVHRH